MLTRTFEFKLKPTTEQASLFEAWLIACRQVYNYALAERKAWVNSRKCAVNACSLSQEYIIPADTKRPNFASQCRSLTQARKDFPELGNVHVHVLQETLKRLEIAFVAMWDRGHGFPRFKSTKRMRSFNFKQMGVNPLQEGKVKLPKIGWVKMRQSRPIPEGFELKQVRIVRRVSGWYAMLVLKLEVDVPNPMPHGEPLGIDLGLEKFLATSTGKLIARPKFFVSLQSKLKSLQKKMSRKKKGSSNWKKAGFKVAKLHEHISNTRKDFHYKTAGLIASEAGMVFAEDLNLKAMSRGMLRKHTLDAGFGQFLNILEFVCWKQGVYFNRVDPNLSSQTCPKCQTLTGKKELSERVHSCPTCGYTTDRDVAAAQVIEQRGVVAVGRTVQVC
ncbi:RNA-guided endonuclease TnpB family protein [Pleurocapsa sp. PCC 7319]|uniref:RNA-guided endonuclease InsQ/TnpB family protein n=1 Tax=Pleurocapsa sp. PCC 7319 TaxID=118161 RepID=UPI00034739A6|nr:RNA-guided endonuclease TnpB family protein [Pleurocapsa sp. PCC 7319]